MLEIWVEDSTVGYKFFNMLNRNVMDTTYRVIKHDGMGEKKPSKSIPTGGVLYHIKHETNNKKLVLLVVDKALDRQETKENYVKIQNEIVKHSNMFLIKQHSFEKCILSYKKKNNIIGSKDVKTLRLVEEFVRLCNTFKYEPIYMSTDFREYISNHRGKEQSEHIGKSLLGDLTSVAVIVNKVILNPSLISRGKIGPCWCKSCCGLGVQLNNRKCSISNGIPLSKKIQDIKTYSDYNEVYEQIKSITHSYLFDKYKASCEYDKKYEQKYRQERSNVYKDINKYMDSTSIVVRQIKRRRIRQIKSGLIHGNCQ